MPVVKTIHLICPREMHIEDIGYGHFVTSAWVVSAHNASTAEFVALHGKKCELSYLQGRITSWQRIPWHTGSHPMRIRFQFDTNNVAPVRWPATGGTRERAYDYLTIDDLRRAAEE